MQDNRHLRLWGSYTAWNIRQPSRWIPRLFTPNTTDKNAFGRPLHRSMYLTLFMRNPKKLLYCFVIADKKWIFWCTPAVKNSGKSETANLLQIMRRVAYWLQSRRLLFSFWNSQGVIYINYSEKGKAMLPLGVSC